MLHAGSALTPVYVMEWRTGAEPAKKIWPRSMAAYKVSGFDSHGWWKGQVNIALEVLDELKLAIPVCGMVKMIITEPEDCILIMSNSH